MVDFFIMMIDNKEITLDGVYPRWRAAVAEALVKRDEAKNQ